MSKRKPLKRLRSSTKDLIVDTALKNGGIQVDKQRGMLIKKIFNKMLYGFYIYRNKQSL